MAHESKLSQDDIPEERSHQSNSPSVSYTTLFRYATRSDLIVILGSIFFASASGAILPLMTILFGSLSNAFENYLTSSDGESHSRHEINRYSLYLFCIFIAEFVTTFLGMYGFSFTGHRIATATREAYLRAVLSQPVSAFDSPSEKGHKMSAGETASTISSDVSSIQDGISEKPALILSGLSSFVSALIISFIKSWKLSLIVSTTIIAMIVSVGICGKIATSLRSEAATARTKADVFAEEALAQPRTNAANSYQERLATQYAELLNAAQGLGVKSRAAMGLMLGVMTAVVYSEHALAFWQGGRFLRDGEINLGTVVTVQLALMFGAFSLATILPHVSVIPFAVVAGKKVFAVIDQSKEEEDERGEKPTQIDGLLEFKEVKFRYAGRDGEPLFRSLQFTAPAGKVTALVGPSGCGKSTIISLIERFYDLDGGKIELDGNDIKDLNVKWLRRQIGLVGQDPVLFSGTVLENIEFGLVGTEHDCANKEMKFQLAVEAAKLANAHDFILSMPHGYETEVGGRGFLLSGGQKQRIAIARAIISDPRILLLDEATSALDSKSEHAVQHALEQASHGRTTLVIAHRLSTIKQADNIIVISDGSIIEQGSHTALIDRKGIYHDLVRAQELTSMHGASNQPERSVEEHMEVIEKQETFKSIEFSKSLSNAASRQSFRTVARFMFSMSKPEAVFVFLGIVLSILSGANQPIRGILFANAIQSLSGSSYGHTVGFWAVMFLVLAIVQLFALSGQAAMFAVSSERLVNRAQALAFRSILRQDISFYDKPENSPGALTSVLASESARLAGFGGATIGAVLVFAVTVAGSLIIALAYGWKLSLVCASTMPVMISFGFVRFWVLGEYGRRLSRTTQAAGFAAEATAAIRAVKALTLEDHIVSRYHRMLSDESQEARWFFAKTGASYAAASSVMYAAAALGFWYGGNLIVDGEYNLLTFYICFTEILFGAQAAGNILSFAPEIGTGKHAAETFQALINQKPTIDAWSKDGYSTTQVNGNIEFRDVQFRYPQRKEHPALRGLTFEALPGQLVALVGESGSGKSTVLAMLERFYDPDSGSILLDGRPISDYNLSNYRQLFALVSQDTTLYSGTIRENLCLGLENVNEEDIIAACETARIYDFIVSLPDGLNTDVGAKGSSVSGGQRQRIAIARALLREPQILLLDEATSALDTTSEKLVEEALRHAAKNRTTIAIAHRLTSIYHADIIYVMDQGRVVEKGNHEELLKLKGKYWAMAQLQSLKV